jgi:sugar O-acyltransferase (sialic acid O-acetyltransferase NeuD family)
MHLEGLHQPVGFVESASFREGDEKTKHDLPFLGTDDALADLPRRGVNHVIIAVGGFGDARTRIRLFGLARQAGLELVTVIHPRAYIAPSAQVGKGTCVLPGAIVHSSARVGENVIINTGCSVDHHCEIAAHVHLAPGCHLAGRVKVGEGAQIGTGASVINSLSIGEYAVVGAGAAVLEDVPANHLAVGVPARLIRRE